MGGAGYEGQWRGRQIAVTDGGVYLARVFTPSPPSVLLPTYANARSTLPSRLAPATKLSKAKRA